MIEQYSLCAAEVMDAYMSVAGLERACLSDL